MKTEELGTKAVAVLTETLEQVPFAKILDVKEPAGPLAGRADWAVDAVLADGEKLILVEYKTSGEPRVAREVANEFARQLPHYNASYGVFMAPYISPRAADICREAGIGYADLAGNCYLSFGNIYIERDGRPNAFSEKRVLRSLYSPKAERVLRVLFRNVHEPWKLQALADEARVSLGQVHKVKSVLADREFIESGSEGIRLSKPQELLGEWAKNYTYRRNRIYEYYSLKALGELEAGIATTCKDSDARYALAGFSAAARLAPFTRYQRAQAYVEEEAIAKIVETLDLRKVTSGANLALWVPYDEGIWYGDEVYGGITVTSRIQTYLDLCGMHGRAEDAADFLLKEAIEPEW